MYPYMYIYFNDRCCYAKQMNENSDSMNKTFISSKIGLNTYKITRDINLSFQMTVVIIGNFLDLGNWAAGSGEGLLTSPIYTVVSSLHLHKKKI